ncbi:MAG TPA: ArsR family transcriptional regulator [bacterium]|nr:ArsR family transcriptional regulator [bacterium]
MSSSEIAEKERLAENVLGSKARVKILKALALNDELTISLLINKTRLNHAITMKHLKILESLDLITEKKFGRIRIYKYNFENLKARSLKKFIDIWEDNTELK